MKKILSIFFVSLFSLYLISCKSNREDNKQLLLNSIFFNKTMKSTKWSKNRGFSIAVIPDSQSYTNMEAQTFNLIPYPINQWEIYNRQTKFIAQNSIKNGGDFAFALHVGDHIEHRNWRPREWKLSEKAFLNLNNEIPVLTVPGNHDYDRWVGIKNYQTVGSKSYNKYFGPDSISFKDKEWYKGSSNEGRNSWAIFNAAEMDFIVIGLELNPDATSIKWAQDILDNNKNLPAIILTHAYLSKNQEEDDNEHETVYSNGEYYKKGVNFKFTKADYRRKFDGWMPEKIWEDFISQNNQIFLVVCGHVGTETKACGYRIDQNKYGYTTYSLLSNFQDFNNYLDYIGIKYKNKKPCGDGWLSIIDINLTEKRIDFSCFNTETGKYMHGEPFEVSFPINWDWKERLNLQ
ncbi:MAG: metallophosphoesterase [Treponema sp.]|nr:metallophosphoesterase [Treponema sp.]